jgi:hypothetical protein
MTECTFGESLRVGERMGEGFEEKEPLISRGEGVGWMELTLIFYFKYLLLLYLTQPFGLSLSCILIFQSYNIYYLSFNFSFQNINLFIDFSMY